MSLLSRLAITAARAYGVLSSKSNFVSASYLVVAGGGGTGQGGGGAGGLLTSTVTLSTPNTYTVTVGAGGAAGTNIAAAVNGSNSVLSGTGLTTITATGGGAGGIFANGSTGANNGVSGGSGGGGGGADTGSTGGTGAAGTSGQGFAGGNGSSLNTISAGGGGGGGGAVGTNAVTSTGGSGGVGATSSISGTSTYYAGGGSGGGSVSVAGGLGGGGAGSPSNTIGNPGTANTGGGGGGAGNTTGGLAGGAGGSGIIIISYAGSQAFNGGLVTSSGGNTIHTFLASGVLTPLTNNLTSSLRFRASATAYLSRTFASSGTNNKIQTFSAWVKRGLLSSSTDYRLMGGYDGSSANSTEINFNNDSLRLEFGGAANNPVITTQVFRDPSAWYHIVVAIDTTQATAANRVKMYVNGNQVTAFSTATYPAQNALSQLTSANVNNRIGSSWSGSNPFDGYMTDINFIDGQALEPYYFGNNDAYGNWKPILYKGTYGTNGFYLTFGNTTSTTTLGYDSSSNANNWTTNNISLTAGITYDAMTDVPTNTNSTIANYCTLNPLPYYGGYNVISQGNLQFTSGNSNWMRGLATFAVSSGKWYWEVTVNNTHSQMHGILTETTPSYYAGSNNWVGYDATGYGYFSDDGTKWNNNASVAYGAAYDTSDIIGIAFDADNGKLYFSKNGTFQASGDPAAGTNAAFTGLTSGPYVPAVSLATTSGANTCDTNFGQRPFSYTPPTGFLSLNTFNLSTPAILQGNRYMDATLATGSNSTQVIVNQGQFKPDFVWLKIRSAVENHIAYDSVRGVQQYLVPNLTLAEATLASGLTSFNSNGFTLGNANPNYSGSPTFVGWQWQAGQGTSSSNTSGTITSTVSVSTTAGFSIVTYTGTGSAATIGHGLGVAPKMIIVKGRNATIEWLVYHASLGATQYITLNTTGAAASAASAWNNTAPTSSVFSVLSAGSTNFSGRTYVAYCWAEIAGFSKFGSYTGNGSADGLFVYTGFRPKWILIKNASSSVQGWTIQDTSRSTYNVVDNYLLAQADSAEQTIYARMDYLSNGFKIRTSDALVNGSGNTIIYMAFAENPFKNANAR